MKHNRKKRRTYYKKNHTMVLKLNKAYMPIDVCVWEDAIGDWFTGRAEIESVYEDRILRSGRPIDSDINNEMHCPAVIRMVDTDVTQYDLVRTIPITREGLYNRDDGKCCYCSKEISIDEMTIEHVYPESKGGLDTWGNLRAACNECNHEKGDKLLSELGWTLRKRVSDPRLTEEAPKSIVNLIGDRILHESWRKYIYWQIKIDEKVRDI